jgi:membrane protease YdiL (CAAX protease family)
MSPTAVRRSTIVLGGIAIFQAAVIAIFHDVFLRPLAANLDRTSWYAWALGAVVAVAYVTYSIRGLPIIGTLLWKISAFKLMGLVVALPAAILEEVFFRGYLMDVLATTPVAVQIGASALSFGLAHVVWGIRGGPRAMLAAVGSTTLMGAALAVVYLASNRVILPCVIAHFIITLALEPWLMYAYVERAEQRGERSAA